MIAGVSGRIKKHISRLINEMGCQMNRVLIIAEAGVNHNGNIELAKKLAVAAKESGADIVKFQTAKLESLVTGTAPMAEYQKVNIGRTQTQKEMLEKFLLSFDEFEELSEYCREIGIQFLSTPFDMESIDFLSGIGCALWKIPSGEITNYPYLIKVACLHQPIILSTGMSTLEEVDLAVKLLKDNDAGPITLMHCTTEYPTPYEDVNLQAMKTLQRHFGNPVGYSDHTLGIEVPIAAVGMGAEVIEKHFTLDRNMEGPDHRASLEPGDLSAMVSSIRKIEAALGDGVKRPVTNELSNISVVRKSIVAKCRILKGEKYTPDNITTKRPGTGINPMRWNEVIGSVADRDYETDEMIQV